MSSTPEAALSRFSCHPAASPQSHGPSYRRDFPGRRPPRTPEAPAAAPSPSRLSLLSDKEEENKVNIKGAIECIDTVF